MSQVLLLLLCAVLPLGVTAATSGWVFGNISSSKDLVWYPCLTIFQCALLDVPLDYAAPNGSRAAVPLIKLPARDNSPNGSYQGMILTNPGGPGGSGVNFLIEDGRYLQNVIGSNFDLVSWDPRGIGSSIPSSNCTALGSSADARRRSYELHGSELADSFFEGEYALAKSQGRQCQALVGGVNGAGPHMTTAVNVRDMISILNLFAQSQDGQRVAEPSLLNYWGFSYGTFIGETFGSMFPDRVGRVVLDGIVDADSFSAGIDSSNVLLTDDVLGTFFVYCHFAGLKLCPFYTGTTVEDIYIRLEKIILPLDATEAAAQNWTNATIIEEVLEYAKSALLEVLYSPISLFPQLASLAVEAEAALNNGSLTSILKLAANQNGPPTNATGWLRAVRCTDDGGASYNKTLQDLQAYIQELEKQSYVAGEFWSESRILCTGWSITARDRYAGPFGGSTKNPILFVSNTLDPVTPIINGRKWSSQFKGVGLITIEGIGHTSLATQNVCGYSKIGAFFQTGHFPNSGDESFCPLEAGPFGVVLTGEEKIKGRRDLEHISKRMRQHREQRLDKRARKDPESS